MSTTTIRWEGPAPTPDDTGIDTPLEYLNESWRIGVALLDKGRKLYWDTNGASPEQEDPLGRRGAWLPVSLGERGHMPASWDERDIRHSVRMMTYLWSDEPGLADEYTENLFFQHMGPHGEFRGHDGELVPYANIHSMYAMVCGDMLRYFELPEERAEAVLQQAAAFVEYVLQKFDPEHSGLLNVGENPEPYAQGFWGTHLGEPNHYPGNYDPTNKAVCPSMAFAVFMSKALAAAKAHGSPAAAGLAEALRRTVDAIEGQAWSELGQYYYIQRDDNSGRWFHSLNGSRETSRETDVVPHYAAELCPDAQRARQVGRVLHDALVSQCCFPMPQFYPTYAWYSPASPNGVDMGDDCGQIGGAWDTAYFHCVQALERAGLQQALHRAILRRAEVAHRDGDFLESYRLDGTVDHAAFFNRDEYVVSATAHVTAIVEGLFGVSPAGIGFREINIRPNLPLYRRHRHTTHPSPWAQRDNRLRIRLGNGKRLDLTVRYDEEAETLTLQTNAVGVPAHIRLPLDLASRFKGAAWDGEPVDVRVEQGMDCAFLHVDHALDGGALEVQLDPHPQKGQGTTPAVLPKAWLPKTGRS